jgi:TonB family protein
LRLARTLGPPILLSVSLHASVLALSGLSRRLSSTPAASGTSASLTVAPIDVSLAGPSDKGRRSAPAEGAVVAFRPAAQDPAKGSNESTGTAGAAASAPAAPGATSDPSAIGAYAAQVRERISLNLRYPLSLQRRGVSGHASLRITLSPGSPTAESQLIQSTGSAELDELALEAARAASPFPPAPPGVAEDAPLVLNVPVEFRLKR